MIDNKIRQCHIAKKAGIHANVIYWWVSGRSYPNGYYLALLAETLHQLTDPPRSEILDNMATAILKG